MEIIKNQNGNELDIELVGRLDTTTAPELDEEVKNALDGVEKLVFDFTKLEYISSAGLRVLLAAHKIMSKQGEMILTNVNDDVKEVFEITGFVEILNIQ